MHKIEKKSWGYKLIFADHITPDEMAGWVDDSRKALTAQSGKFGVFVDMRSLRPLDPKAQELMKDGQKLYKEKGMERSVVVLNSSVLTMQFKRLAKETGIYEWERYIDASSHPDWEARALSWIEKGVDPD